MPTRVLVLGASYLAGLAVPLLVLTGVSGWEALRRRLATWQQREPRTARVLLVTAAALLCLYLAAQTGLQVTGPPGGL